MVERMGGWGWRRLEEAGEGDLDGPFGGLQLSRGLQH